MKQGDKGYWEWRKNTGAPKALKSPEQLWGLACDYFKSVDERPIFIEEQRRSPIRVPKEAWFEMSDDELKALERPVIRMMKARPYTWAGLEAYLFERGILKNLSEYRNNYRGGHTEFAEVCRAIDRTMYAQKFEGAASGIFNHAIIARELGLADRSKIQLSEEQPLFGDDNE